MNPILDSLPDVGETRMAVRITKDALRQVRAGHPWIFDGAVTEISHVGDTGDLAVIFDSNRRFVAIGLWDPNSPIPIRLVHAGKPATIDSDWWLSQILDADRRRQVLADDASTTGWRMINGESDGFPALILDRYDNTLVMKIYSPSWLPHLATIVQLINEVYEPEALVLRMSRTLADAELFGLYDGMALIGEAPEEPVSFLESGLEFAADVVWGQKTGHFLDQRENRRLLAAMVTDSHVLDVFCNTGGFTVSAAAGGAASVHSVDSSEDAIAATVENLALNAALPAVQACHHTHSVNDAFKELADLAEREERFDVAIVDPPSFAPNAQSVDNGRRAYGRLTRLALAVLEPGGLLVQASCSSRIGADDFYETVVGAADRSGFELREIARTAHAVDHPAGFAQAYYLKAIFAHATMR